jgi:hypothetical protein
MDDGGDFRAGGVAWRAPGVSPSAPQSKESILSHRVLGRSDDPNGSHTQYLIIYPTGAVTEAVDEMIDRVVANADLPDEYKITGIMLIVNDGDNPVWVEVHDRSDGQGLEWEILQPGTEQVVEYLLYDDDERIRTHTREVFVEGFPDEPGYPVEEEEMEQAATR